MRAQQLARLISYAADELGAHRMSFAVHEIVSRDLWDVAKREGHYHEVMRLLQEETEEEMGMSLDALEELRGERD